MHLDSGQPCICVMSAGGGWRRDPRRLHPRPRSSQIAWLRAVSLSRSLRTDRLVDEDGHGEFDLQCMYFDVRLDYLPGCQVERFARLPGWLVGCEVARLAVLLGQFQPGWLFARLSGWRRQVDARLASTTKVCSSFMEHVA